MPARLAQHLVNQGLLSIGQVEEAARQQAAQGGSLDTALLEAGLVAEAGILQALGDVSSLRPVNLADFEPNLDAHGHLPREVVERLGIVPLSVDGDTLHVAAAYPLPRAQLQELRVLLGRPIEPWMAIEARVRDWIAILYRVPLAARFEKLLRTLDPSRNARGPSYELVQEELGFEERIALEVSGETVPLTARKGRPSAAAEPTLFLTEPLPIPPEALRPEQRAFPSTPPPSVPLGATPSEIFERFGPGAQAPAASPGGGLSPYPAEPPPARFPTPAIPAVPSMVVFSRGDAMPSSSSSSSEESDLDEEGVRALAPMQSASLALDLDDAPPDVGAFDREFSGLGSPKAAPEEKKPVVRPPPTWTLDQARSALKAASSRDDILRVTLQYARGTFQFAAAFAVVRGSATLWQPAEATSTEPTSEPASPLSIPLDAATIFRTVAVTHGSFLGPPPMEGLTREYLSRLGRVPASVFLFPVEVKGRLVCLLYADHGNERPPDRGLSEFILFCQELPGAFARLLLEKKRKENPQAPNTVAPASPLQPVVSPPANDAAYPTAGFMLATPASSTPPPAPSPVAVTSFPQAIASLKPNQLITRPAPSLRESDSPASSNGSPHGSASASNARDRTSTLEMPALAPFASQAPRRTTTLSELPAAPVTLGRRPEAAPQTTVSPQALAHAEAQLPALLGNNPSARSTAISELQRMPEAAAQVLAREFPGPLTLARLPLSELPDADELGPIPGALARLGRPAAHALSPLMHAEDSDLRYFALLTAGHLPYPELVAGVVRNLFDPEPDVAAAARAASVRLRRLPRFVSAMPDIRRELSAEDELQRALAARALGSLRDRASVESLIMLTGSRDELVAENAAEALAQITKLRFGATPTSWRAWWRDNQNRSRAEWVVAALRSERLESRTAAIEELTHAIHDDLGFEPDGDPDERQAAVRRWEQALTSNEGLRVLE